MEAIMNPGSHVKTGMIAQTMGPEFLRDGRPEELMGYAAIWLMDIPRLDRRAIDNLEAYVQGGGGLAILFGDQSLRTSVEVFNQEWHRGGAGFLPVRLKGIQELPRATAQGAVDIAVDSHPIFQPLLGLNNSPLQMVRVSRYMALVQEGTAISGPDKPIRTIAKLRDGSPLVLDAGMGQGRVVVVLTALDPRWTNWPQDPTFVVSVLKMMGYLGSFRQRETSSRVGQPIEQVLSNREYLPATDVLLPSQPGSSGRVQMSLNALDDPQQGLVMRVGHDLAGQTEEMVRALSYPGVTEIWSTRIQGQRTATNFSRNPSPIEGDLARVLPADLTRILRPVTVRYRTADSVSGSALSTGLSNRNSLFFGLLLLLLLLEQFLAWRTSYHLPLRAGSGA
jgi:hypothetical protein